jgi:predicted transporter
LAAIILMHVHLGLAVGIAGHHARHVVVVHAGHLTVVHALHSAALLREGRAWRAAPKLRMLVHAHY